MNEGNAAKGHYGSVWEVLPTLEGLLSAIDDGLNRVRQNGRWHSPLAVAYQNAWEKLDKYYKITDDSYSIYAAATFFSPPYRLTYFDLHWSTLEMGKVKDKMIARVRQIWEQEYKDTDPKEDNPPPTKRLKPNCMRVHGRDNLPVAIERPTDNSE